MKNSTALRQSRQSVKFLAIAVPIMWAAFFWLRLWQLAMFAGFMTLFLMGDVGNILYINKKQKQNPEFLKKKLPGT